MSLSSSSTECVNVRPELGRIVEYVPGESLEAFSTRTGVPLHEIVKLNSNESPYGPAAEVLEAMGNYMSYNTYPDTNSTGLRAALSTYTGVDPQFIVVGGGSGELIYLLWRLFLAAGDGIICCPPTFSLYTTSTTLCGASVVEVPRASDYELDIESILGALLPSTKLIALCSPNNPTGNPVREEDVMALLETGRIVVVDEAYVEFSDHPRGLAHLVPMYRNLVVLRTFSKWAGLAGLRIGYAICPDWIAGYIRQVQHPFEVNVAGHIAAILTLKNLEYVQQNVHCIVRERERLFEVLAGQSYLEPVPSQGNFILAHLCNDALEIEQVRAAVEARGILLRYFQSPALRRSLRVTVGLSEHTERLARALASIEV